MGAHRPMTVAEKYYTFLDRAWPTNVLISAELGRRLDPAFVAERWRAFRTSRVLTRAVATEDLTIADIAPGTDHFSFDERPATEWDDVLDEEAAIRHPLGLSMRCRYLASPDEERSLLLLVGHHAIIDGRVGLAELQEFVRFLDGQEVPSQQQLSIPAEDPGPRHRWQQDSRALIDLLRQIKARGAELGEPGPDGWPSAELPRRSRLRQVVLGPQEAAQVVAAGRSHGANAFSTIAAAWLSLVARELCAAAPTATMQLAVPADTSAPSQDRARPTPVSVAVLSQPFRVDVGDLWGLAADIRSSVLASLDRGEGDLFFHLTRIAHVDDLETGAGLVSSALAAGPPCVAVSNMGVIDPGTDPSWLLHLNGQLAAAPNQVVFASALSYRGRLSHTISTDDNRLPADRSGALVAKYVDLVRHLSPGSG